MSLTKDDLLAIRGLVTEVVDERLEKFEVKIDEKFEPMRETMRRVLKAQIEVVDKLDDIERRVHLIMMQLNLSPTSRELRKSLGDID